MRKGGRRCWVGRLPFGPLARAAQSPSSSLRTDAPASPTPTATTWQPYTSDVGPRPLRPCLLVGTPPRSPRPPSILSPSLSLFFPTRERSSSSSRRGAIAGRAPPLIAGRFGRLFSTLRALPYSS